LITQTIFRIILQSLDEGCWIFCPRAIKKDICPWETPHGKKTWFRGFFHDGAWVYEGRRTPYFKRAYRERGSLYQILLTNNDGDIPFMFEMEVDQFWAEQRLPPKMLIEINNRFQDLQSEESWINIKKNK